MAIIDDIVRTTQKAGKVIADTATDVFDYTKASYNIASVENKLKEVLIEIGCYTVAMHKDGTQDEEKLGKLLEREKALSAQLAQLKSDRAEIKNEIVCPSCGKHNVKESAFCNACGTKLGE